MVINKVDYVTPSLAGRLGNQMFMIANAYARAKEHNKQLLIYKKALVYEKNDYSQNIFKNFEFIDEWIDNRNYNPPVPSDNTHTIYVGYFQSEKYFENFKEDVKNLFGPPVEFVERIKQTFPFIFNKTVAVINIRKGDYLSLPKYHPTVSVEYIYKSMEKIPNVDVYIIASDDIQWCKDNLKINNSFYLEGYLPHEQLWIMSLCHHFIISNSSFSWWAAYLSKNPDKVVVAPETWFGPDGPKQWKEIYCKNWMILPTYYSEGLIYPKL